MIADINAGVVNETRHFVTALMKSVLCPLGLVHRRGVLGEASMQRNQIGKGRSQGVDVARRAEGIPQTFYGGKNGVGYIKARLWYF